MEVQGLSSPSSFGHPRRTANGVDLNRLLLTVAVLQRRVGLHLADQDVFVNVVGGLRIDEPGVDLAVAAALASSARDRVIAADVALIGEIGLSGEVRSVPQLEARLREASRLGFRRVLVPWSLGGEVQTPPGVTLLPAHTLREALALLELTATARSTSNR